MYIYIYTYVYIIYTQFVYNMYVCIYIYIFISYFIPWPYEAIGPSNCAWKGHGVMLWCCHGVFDVPQREPSSWLWLVCWCQIGLCFFLYWWCQSFFCCKAWWLCLIWRQQKWFTIVFSKKNKTPRINKHIATLLISHQFWDSPLLLPSYWWKTTDFCWQIPACLCKH